MNILALLFICYKLLLFFSEFSYALDTINSSQPLSDGRSLISKDGSFELGFFSPGNSSNRYLGIWYKKIPVKTVVWVANRLNPINDSSGLLMINKTGNLVLMSQNESVVWSTNLTTEVRSPVVAQLLDSGNLVLSEQEGNLEAYLWQSFDYPSDTLLPGMKLGWDLKTGLERRLTSWKSSDDPTPGDFTWEIEVQDNPEAVMWKGSTKFYRSGPWNGRGFSGAPELRPNSLFNFSFVANEDELYYTFGLTNTSVLSRIVMNQTEYERQRFTWSEETQSWMLYATVPRDRCDSYGLCGANGVCVLSESPICQCLRGFMHKSENTDWSQGCARIKQLSYSKTDGFVKFDGLKLPDATHCWVDKSLNLEKCKEKCLENSSCMAYASSDIREGGSGCAMWFGDLIDMKQLPDGGQDLYIRMPVSELGGKDENKKKKKKIGVLVACTVAAVIAGVLLLTVIHRIHKRRKKAAGDFQSLQSY